MKKITLDYIDTFKPCDSGRENLIENYGEDFKYSIKQFLNLKNIPYDDKIWLACKVIDYKILQRWSLACARSVSHLYGDDTLVKILNDVETALNNDDLKLAKSVAESAAKSAEESAEESARSAAESARSAARSTGWSAAWSAESARSAVRSVESTAEQEKLNIQFLKELL